MIQAGEHADIGMLKQLRCVWDKVRYEVKMDEMLGMHPDARNSRQLLLELSRQRGPCLQWVGGLQAFLRVCNCPGPCYSVST